MIMQAEKEDMLEVGSMDNQGLRDVLYQGRELANNLVSKPGAYYGSAQMAPRILPCGVNGARPFIDNVRSQKKLAGIMNFEMTIDPNAPPCTQSSPAQVMILNEQLDGFLLGSGGRPRLLSGFADFFPMVMAIHSEGFVRLVCFVMPMVTVKDQVLMVMPPPTKTGREVMYSSCDVPDALTNMDMNVDDRMKKISEWLDGPHGPTHQMQTLFRMQSASMLETKWEADDLEEHKFRGVKTMHAVAVPLKGAVIDMAAAYATQLVCLHVGDGH